MEFLLCGGTPPLSGASYAPRCLGLITCKQRFKKAQWSSRLPLISQGLRALDLPFLDFEGRSFAQRTRFQNHDKKERYYSFAIHDFLCRYYGVGRIVVGKG
jgi:hypothetical protein